jgi:hypothetical protein
MEVRSKSQQGFLIFLAHFTTFSKDFDALGWMGGISATLRPKRSNVGGYML